MSWRFLSKNLMILSHLIWQSSSNLAENRTRELLLPFNNDGSCEQQCQPYSSQWMRSIFPDRSIPAILQVVTGQGI